MAIKKKVNTTQIVFVARRLVAARLLYEFVSRNSARPAHVFSTLSLAVTVPVVTAWPSRLPLRIFNGSFTNDVMRCVVIHYGNDRESISLPPKTTFFVWVAAIG
jgi:hypothetical protein